MRLAHNAITAIRAFQRRFSRSRGYVARQSRSWDISRGLRARGSFERVSRRSSKRRKALHTKNSCFLRPSTGQVLIGYFYMVRKPELEGMIATSKAASAISPSASTRNPACLSPTRKEVSLRGVRNGEAYEGSLVWLGAQPGATMTKGASSVDIQDAKPKTKEEKTMKEITKALGLGNDATEDQAVKAIHTQGARLSSSKKRSPARRQRELGLCRGPSQTPPMARLTEKTSSQSRSSGRGSDGSETRTRPVRLMRRSSPNAPSSR